MTGPGKRALVMGVLNVTPDSFSDAGRYFDLAAAVARGAQMREEGADVIDVGGESTRPGAAPVPEGEELRRVLPVVEALARELAGGTVGDPRAGAPGTRISVDTTKPAVARAAVGAGATLLNDVGGALLPLAAELHVGWVAMHSRGTPRTMQSLTRYDDVVSEVHGELLEAASRALGAGVPEVWVDPGIGFAKTAEQNVALLAALPELTGRAEQLGARVLVGTSRKSFLGRFGAPTSAPAPTPVPATAAPPVTGAAGAALPVGERLEASLATAVWSMVAGAAMVRVHDVADTVRAAILVGG